MWKEKKLSFFRIKFGKYLYKKWMEKGVLNKKYKSFTPVTLTTWEAKIWKTMVQGK
jgi:hypothetical protein